MTIRTFLLYKSRLYSWAALAPEKGRGPRSGKDRQAVKP
jgi:hypothetical protein